MEVPQLVPAASASLPLSSDVSQFFPVAQLSYSYKGEKASFPHTVLPFVQWALVWLVFSCPTKTRTHTLLPFFLPSHKSMWFGKGTIFKDTLFSFVALHEFPRYPLFQAKTPSLLSSTRQKNSPNPGSSTHHFLKHLRSLLTPSVAYELRFTDSGKQEKSHLFIFYKSNYSDFQVLPAWWLSGASCHVWSMELCLKASQNPTVQTYHFSLETYCSSNCCLGEAHSPSPCLTFRPFFLSTPTQFRGISFLSGKGNRPSPTLIYFLSYSASSCMLLGFLSSTSPKSLWFPKGLGLGNKEPRHLLISVLQHSSPEATWTQKSVF